MSNLLMQETSESKIKSHDGPTCDNQTPAPEPSGVKKNARSFSVLTSAASSQFVDFYALLGEPENASTSRLRGRMAELYAEAQSNRDHRNAATRRRYLDLLETLPKCRAILLDTKRRAQYDDYIMQSRVGAHETDFQTFVSRLTSAPAPRSANYSEWDIPENEDDFSNVMSVREDARTNGQSVQSENVQSQSVSDSQSLSHHSEELQRDAAIHLALMARMASACGATLFLVALVVLRSAMRETLTLSLGIAFMVGAVSWFGARQFLLRRKVQDVSPSNSSVE